MYSFFQFLIGISSKTGYDVVSQFHQVPVFFIKLARKLKYLENIKPYNKVGKKNNVT